MRVRKYKGTALFTTGIQQVNCWQKVGSRKVIVEEWQMNETMQLHTQLACRFPAKMPLQTPFPEPFLTMTALQTRCNSMEESTPRQPVMSVGFHDCPHHDPKVNLAESFSYAS